MPGYLFKIYNKNKKVVYRYYSPKKRACFSKISGGKKTRNGFYSVVITYGNGFYNKSGLCKTKKEVIQAFRAFTEKSLLDEFSNN